MYNNLSSYGTLSINAANKILIKFNVGQKLADFGFSQNISDDLINAMKSACDFISPIRDPLTHQDNISLEEVVERRLEIIELFNNLIDKLYPA